MALVKFQLHVMGLRAYGITVLVMGAFSSLSLLNCGFGSALVSFYKAEGNNSLFWGYLIYSFFGLLGFGLLLISMGFFFYLGIFTILAVPPECISVALYWGAGLLGVSMLLSSVLNAYWLAKVDFLTLKFFGFWSSSFPILLMSGLVAYVPDLGTNFLITGLVNLVAVLCIMLLLMRRSGCTYAVLQRIELHGFIRQIGEFQLISWTAILGRPLFNALVAHKLGVGFTSYFDIALRLVTAGRQVVVAAAEPFFSIITGLHGRNKYRYARLLTWRYSFYMLLAALAFLAGMIIFSRQILQLWLGQAVGDEVASSVKILAIGITFNMVVSVIYYSMLADRSGRIHVLVHQVILLVYSVLMFEWTYSGMEQMAIVYAGSYFVSACYLGVAFLTNRNCKYVVA